MVLSQLQKSPARSRNEVVNKPDVLIEKTWVEAVNKPDVLIEKTGLLDASQLTNQAVIKV